MNNNLETAIKEFLANEYKLDPQNIDEDFSLTNDLHLDPPALADLLQRLQDALNFTIPEDKVLNISTVEDLVAATNDTPEP